MYIIMSCSVSPLCSMAYVFLTERYLKHTLCTKIMRDHLLLVSLLFSIVDISKQSDLVIHDIPISPGDPVRSMDQCLPWQYRSNTSEKCECGHSLESIVLCRNEPYDLQLHDCYCMTQTNEKDQIIVGSCQYTCRRTRNGYYFDITANTSSGINMLMCERYNRQGQLCGSCMPGYAPPVYSYNLSCVNCTTSNWAKYMAVSLLPVTAFFVVVITFRISATSPKLNGLILCLQLLFSPSNQRNFGTSKNSHKPIGLLLTSLYGIWNLDFLRFIYIPFCLQPHAQTALDYFIAVYPFLLIGISYLLVLLNDCNIRIIVWLFKPFVSFFIKFRRVWSIKSSLVDAFATFLLLSYVKILSVSVDLLMPVLLYNQMGHTLPQLYLFNQGDVAFLGSHHLPYACLALFFLLTFTLLPMLLLFFYPCSCFQVFLNRTGCSCQSLHIFMDTFQGHYKNGTNGTRDLRFFSGLNLLLRVIVCASTVLNYQIESYAYITLIICVLAISVALALPYKSYIHNVIESFFLIIISMLFVTFAPLGFGKFYRLEHGTAIIYMILLAIPLLYMAVLIACWFKSWRPISQCWHTLYQKLRRDVQCLISINGARYESLQ